MKVSLLTTDLTLEATLRHVFAATLEENCRVLAGNGGTVPPDDDLYLWDLETCIPSWKDSTFAAEALHVLILSEEEVEYLGKAPVRPVLAALLKPIQRPCIEAVIQTALSHRLSLDTPRGASGACADVRSGDLTRSSLLANLRIQQSYANQTRLMARILHDVRSPMTAVDGYCALLRSGRLGPVTPDQLEISRRISYSVRRISGLVADAFDIARDKNVRAVPVLSSGGLEPCLTRALGQVAPVAISKSIQMSANLQPPDGSLCFDSSEIERVFVNLLENACKFTPVGGAIRVRGSSFFWDRRRGNGPSSSTPKEQRKKNDFRPNAYRLDVMDSGPDIPESAREAFCTPGVSPTGNHKEQGSGLGLAISKSIMTDHSGDLFFTSSTSGAAVFFVLPFARPNSLGIPL